jgi:hypothetical protein
MGYPSRPLERERHVGAADPQILCALPDGYIGRDWSQESGKGS